jgi:hypothetical protein
MAAPGGIRTMLADREEEGASQKAVNAFRGFHGKFISIESDAEAPKKE